MLNKENYVPWLSRLLRYAKSIPNRKLIYNSIMNGPYVRQMIPEPSDLARTVLVLETFHEQTCDELTKSKIKQMEADDLAIQTILLGLPEDIYVAVDSCEVVQEIWLRVQQMMKGSNIGIQEKKAKLFNEWESTYIQQPLPINNNYDPQPSLNQNYMQQHIPNLEDITNPTAAMNTTLALMAKAFKLNYSTPNHNNQRTSSNPRNRQIAQPGMNLGPDNKINMVGGNEGKQFRQYAGQNVENQHRLSATQMGIMTKEKGCSLSSNSVAIAQKEQAGIQLQAIEFDLMVAAANLDEIKKVNANCILMANLQQASTSSTQTDKAPVYDSDGSAKVQLHDNCYNDEIFNMLTQEEQYTELLEPIPGLHEVPQNDINVIFEVSSVEKGEGTVKQHPANVEETCVLYDSLYNNLATEVEKVNSVNLKLRETNANLTTELVRYKNQKRCFEISQENMTNLKGKQITTLNKEISNLSKWIQRKNQPFLLFKKKRKEKKRLKSDFKMHKDELLDKQINLENKIKELDNIVVKTGQSIQMMHMLSPKPYSSYHSKHKMALGYQNPFYLKKVQQKHQSLYNGKVLLEKHDPPSVYDSEETLELAQETKFVRDFQSLAKEAGESLAKHKALELEIKRLLRAVVSQDIMSIV
nr:hypothetical protein [Tanacetum cinerariifolium]